MNKSITVLGFETSCDETAVAVVRVENGVPHLLAQKIYTQYDEHFDYGGVVPEIASRAHLERLPTLTRDVLAETHMTLQDFDGIAAAIGPGLVGGLLMGSTYAKTLAMAAGKPFVAVNHLAGHALSPLLAENVPEFPYLLLLVSGGHCQLVRVDGVNQYETLGSTFDDAAGECLDKTARILGLNPASGALLEKLAMDGDANAIDLPTPNVAGLDFSFSGLKSQILRIVRAEEAPSERFKANVAAATQAMVSRHICEKAALALQQTGLKTLVAAGGVAANKLIRTELTDVATAAGAQVAFPPIALCTDNAAMIALAGALQFTEETNDLAVTVRPRWPLDDSAHTTTEKVNI